MFTLSSPQNKGRPNRRSLLNGPNTLPPLKPSFHKRAEPVRQIDVVSSDLSWPESSPSASSQPTMDGRSQAVRRARTPPKDPRGQCLRPQGLPDPFRARFIRHRGYPAFGAFLVLIEDDVGPMK